jgi:hypothetical protein
MVGKALAKAGECSTNAAIAREVKAVRVEKLLTVTCSLSST